MHIETITHDLFVAKLEELVGKMNGAEILAIPGAYEVLSEKLNNEVLRELCNEDEDD